MTRIITVLVLLFALLGLAIAEQTSINRVYTKMENETAAIIELVRETPDKESPMDTIEFAPYIKARVNALYDYWVSHEHKMSMIIRYIDLSYISDALIYARNFIEFDNKEEALAGLTRLDYLVKSYHKMYGLNGANIL
jgi:hypothetical protein